jgi:hypothetical protein
VEGLPLGWRPQDGERRVGEVLSRLRVERVEDGVVHGAMEYEARGRTWRHAFAMRVFADEAELAAALSGPAWSSTAVSTSAGSSPSRCQSQIRKCDDPNPRCAGISRAAGQGARPRLAGTGHVPVSDTNTRV